MYLYLHGALLEVILLTIIYTIYVLLETYLFSASDNFFVSPDVSPGLIERRCMYCSSKDPGGICWLVEED